MTNRRITLVASSMIVVVSVTSMFVFAFFLSSMQKGMVERNEKVYERLEVSPSDVKEELIVRLEVVPAEVLNAVNEMQEEHRADREERRVEHDERIAFEKRVLEILAKMKDDGD